MLNQVVRITWKTCSHFIYKMISILLMISHTAGLQLTDLAWCPPKMSIRHTILTLDLLSMTYFLTVREMCTCWPHAEAKSKQNKWVIYWLRLDIENGTVSSQDLITLLEWSIELIERGSSRTLLDILNGLYFQLIGLQPNALLWWCFFGCWVEWVLFSGSGQNLGDIPE